MDAITPRRPLFTRLALLASLLAVVAVLASCGDDDDDGGGGGGGGGGTSAASFCDEVKSILTGQSGDPKEFQNAIAKLQKVDPPEDISKDWNTVMDAWDAKDASEVDLEETQKAGVKVQKFIRDECGVSGQSEN